MKAMAKALKESRRARTLRLARRHKNIIHGVLIAAITVSLVTEGGKAADFLFVALSVICEVC
jgi:hypothetical protein